MDRDEPRQRLLSDPARPSALAPFRIRNYRFQWPADLLTSWAFEMETLILGWYVLVETGSVLLLTLFASLGYVGTLVAPMFGVVGDRIGHRDLLAMMRTTYAVLAAVLMTLALSGHLAPLYVFIIAALMGIVRPSDLGVRGALVATIMPHDQLIGAISISRTTMDTGAHRRRAERRRIVCLARNGPGLCRDRLSLYHGDRADALRGRAGQTGLCRRGCRRGAACFAAARPEGGRGLCLDHAAHAGRALGCVPRQPDGVPAHERLAAVYRQGDLRHQPDRARISVGEFRDWLAGRFDRVEPDPRYPGGAADDRRHRRLVRDPAGVRADADGADRDRVPGGGGLLAKPRHDLDRRHPDARPRARISAAG